MSGNDLGYHPDDLKVGAVVRLGEEHYCYGLGTLHLRLTVPPNAQAIWNRLEWVELTGVELRRNGDGDVRTVLARVTGIQIGVPRPQRQNVVSRRPPTRTEDPPVSVGDESLPTDTGPQPIRTEAQ